MGFYEDMEKSLLEAIEIEKGNVPLKVRRGMPVKTYYVADSDGYRMLDFSKLNFSDKKMTYDEALNDIDSMAFWEDILSKRSKVKITKAEKDYEKKRVKLEIT